MKEFEMHQSLAKVEMKTGVLIQTDFLFKRKMACNLQRNEHKSFIGYEIIEIIHV
jgi:hypothetical protein